MKSGDKVRLSTLRLLTAAIKNRQIVKGGALNDAEALEVVRLATKQRREAIGAAHDEHVGRQRPCLPEALPRSDEFDRALVDGWGEVDVEPAARAALRERARRGREEAGQSGPSEVRAIIPGVVVGLIWQWLYQPNYGVINDLLIRAGAMSERIAWLSSPDYAMAAVVFTNVWRGIPFFAIMLLAGLQAVPDELYEAAHVDGAGVLSRFWHITLPLLRPIIVVSTATRIIWTFNYADLIFVMTGGGPANATQITSTYTLTQAYSTLDFGYAGALSVVLLIIMLAFTWFYLRVTKGIEEPE